MQEEVIQFHIRLRPPDDMPEQREGLPRQLDGEGFVKPDARIPQAVQVKPQGYTANQHAQ